MSHQQGNQSWNAPEFSFFSSSFSLFFLMWQDGYLGSVRATHQDTQLTSPENHLGSHKRKRCEDARSLNVTPPSTPERGVVPAGALFSPAHHLCCSCVAQASATPPCPTNTAGTRGCQLESISLAVQTTWECTAGVKQQY